MFNSTTTISEVVAALNAAPRDFEKILDDLATATSSVSEPDWAMDPNWGCDRIATLCDGSIIAWGEDCVDKINDSGEQVQYFDVVAYTSTESRTILISAKKIESFVS